MAGTKDNRFGGVDMEDLIGGPLNAVRDAQSILVHSTLDVIEDVGLEAPDANGVGNVRTANFSFDIEVKSSTSSESSSDKNGA
ncbi:MAG: DUF2589 domain-containing protein [Candidatus Coproplasma sp.]